jgi:hypothetical protein
MEVIIRFLDLWVTLSLKGRASRGEDKKIGYSSRKMDEG